MTRAQYAGSEEIEWAYATPNRPCPICGAAQGPCGATIDLGFVACAHTPSDWLLTNGTWLHPFGGEEASLDLEDGTPHVQVEVTFGGSQ